MKRKKFLEWRFIIGMAAIIPFICAIIKWGGRIKEVIEEFVTYAMILLWVAMGWEE